MKDINEIERLTPEDLERIASDTSVRVPSDLKASLEALAGAAEFAKPSGLAAAEGNLQKGPEMTVSPSFQRGIRSKKAIFDGSLWKRPMLWGIPAVAAALVAAVIVFRSVPKEPEDTFSDPYLAYAEVQKAFGQISQKGEEAAAIAGNAVPVMEKTEDLLNRLMK